MKKRVCPKCGDRNLASNYSCSSCGESLTNAEIVEEDFQEVDQNSSYKSNENLPLYPPKEKKTHIFLYIFSFLIPIVGIIAGINILSKEDYEELDTAKVCLILVLFGQILIVIANLIKHFTH